MMEVDDNGKHKEYKLTQDNGELPLSNLWNETENCYQLPIEDAIEGDNYYLELHFTGDVYRMIEGKKTVVDISKGEDVLFTSSADFYKFEGIRVDGEFVERSNYVAKEGSTKIFVKSSYLKTLAVGDHILEIVSSDGSATTEFTITSGLTPSIKTPSKKKYIIPNTGVE